MYNSILNVSWHAAVMLKDWQKPATKSRIRGNFASSVHTVELPFQSDNLENARQEILLTIVPYEPHGGTRR
ncbi:MAG: hypothetical protein HRF40_08315 [Nitrososphaera sp.]